MRELGIDPPPKLGIEQWGMWSQWFQRLRNAVAKTQTFSAILNPSAVSANTTAEQTFTVKGLTTADIVTVNPADGLSAGLSIAYARVSAADTLAIAFGNHTGGALDPAEQYFHIVAIRR